MLILLSIITALQVAMFAYMVVHFRTKDEPVEVTIPEPVEVGPDPIELLALMERRVGEALADMQNDFDSRLATVSDKFLELSEHTDNVLEIVTSVALESQEHEANYQKLTGVVTNLSKYSTHTKDLLDRTIDSIDWDDDGEESSFEVPVESSAPNRPYIPPVPPTTPPVPAQPLPTPSNDPRIPPATPNQVTDAPIVGVRGDNDPLITDLRAEPFRDDPSAYADPHELPMSADYEVMGTGRGRQSSRTNGLRGRYVR